MKLNQLHKIWTGLALAFLALACEPEGLETRFAIPSSVQQGLPDWGEIPVGIAVVSDGARTKASLLNGVESRGSGALVLVYRSDTRRLASYAAFSQAQLDAQASTPLKIRVPLGSPCDFYIIGNLVAVRRSNGTSASLLEAMKADFPVDEADLEALEYRLDGGVINETYRRESFSEVATYGIPYQHVAKNVDVSALISSGQGIPGADRCVRLFSKVSVTIDHRSFDGGVAANLDCFVNRTLYMRQVNNRLRPFSGEPVKAERAADILAQAGATTDLADYDASMTNGTKNTYVFYVPENMQGTSVKSRDNSGISPAARDYGTYAEFLGTLGAGGFSGDVTYRFYLGENATDDFNLSRGKEYRVTLEFSAGSLFDPVWKVEADLTDSRLFNLTADPAFTDPLPAGRTVAVRKNRPGAFYVYMNTDGAQGAANALQGKEATVSGSFDPETIADCSWTGDLLKAGTADADWLAARGISASWDKTNCRLVLSVTDASKFDAHLGESRTLSMRVLPDAGAPKSASFSLSLLPDISVSVTGGSGSLSNDFYLGQKRRVSLSGFAGSTVRFAAVQQPCGSESGTARTANRQWKTSSDASAPFPSCRVDASGNVSLKVEDYPDQTLSGGALDIYAFYPNRFQSSHSGWSSRDGKILFFSEDYLNDSFELSLRILEPRYVPWTSCSESAALTLPIDGTAKAMGSLYRKYSGSGELRRADFEPDLYDRLLQVSVSCAEYVSGKEWMAAAVEADADGELYVGKTLLSGNKLEEQDSGTLLGAVNITPNPATGLFGGVSKIWCKMSKLVFGEVNSSDSMAGWTLNSITNRYSSYYLMLLKDASGNRANDRMTMRVGYAFPGGDLSRVSFSFDGDKMSYTTAAGTTIGPVIDYSFDNYYVSWTFDAARQVTFADGETIPGELLLPYGSQHFIGSYPTRDSRTIVEKRSVDISYICPYVVFAAFGSSSAKLFVTAQRNADLLARKGASMTHAGREFCIKVLGVALSSHLKGAQKFYDADYRKSEYVSNPSRRGKYELSGSHGYATVDNVTVNGLLYPLECYRESGLSGWSAAAAGQCVTEKGTLSGNGYLRYVFFTGFGLYRNNNYTPSMKGSDIGYGDRFDYVQEARTWGFSSFDRDFNTAYSTETISSGGTGDPSRYYLWLGSTPW